MYASASVPLSQSVFSLFFSFSSGHQSSLDAHTKPPDALTLKFNGCIIFIAALSLSDSCHFKAFLGTRPGRFRKPCSGWRALAPSSSRTGREDNRGSRLHYPQLCDDSFEEHVLSYSAERAGLHLYRLNECSNDFKTQSTAVVDDFAREWGLIVTAS
jgi:tRNA ligase